MATWLHGLGWQELALVVLAFFGGLTLVSSAIGFLYEHLLRHRRIWGLPLKPGQLAFEARSNVGFILVQAVAMTAALQSGLLRLTDGGSPWLTAGATHVVFQIYYFALHRAMHHPRIVRVHRHHHWSQVTTPLSGQSVSLVEALGWAAGYVGAPALLAFVMPVSAAGLVGYLVFNVYGNLVGHANFEVFPRWVAANRTLAFFAPPFLFHALHHARWNGHYGFATAWTDRLFGTEWADYPALEERIQSGHPLTSLKARGDTEVAVGSEPPIDAA